MKVKHKKLSTFLMTHNQIDRVLAEANDFATGIGRENLINITHSAGIVIIWYWG